MKKIKSLKFEAELVLEHSHGTKDVGKHKCEMILYRSDKNTNSYCIDWINPVMNCGIGIYTNAKREVIDYDGIYSLPKEAIKLLRMCRIVVPREFCPRLKIKK